MQNAHVFDIQIAEKVGVNAATIFSNIQFWCAHNAANQKHLHDGHYWTYNSVAAFTELFPYLSARQIRTALDKLIAVEFIKEGSFNKINYDRTKWYCVAETAICQKSQIHLSEKSNPFVRIDKPIPDSKPDSKPDNKSMYAQGFESWWKAYPRKIGKGLARKKYEGVVKSGTTEILLMQAIQRQLPGWKDTEEKYIPHAATWLGQERWNDEIKKTKKSWSM